MTKYRNTDTNDRRANLVNNYPEVAISALSAALMCRHFCSQGKHRQQKPTWLGNPNMSGILAGIAES